MPFHSCERRAGFSRHRKWRPQLAPLPPRPHPPLQGSDSSTGTSTQEDQGDLWRLRSKNFLGPRPRRDGPARHWRHRGGAEAEETRGKTPVAQREGCRHKIIRFQGEERETQHCEAALRSEIPSSGAQKNTWFLTHQTAEHVGKQEFS